MTVHGLAAQSSVLFLCYEISISSNCVQSVTKFYKNCVFQKAGYIMDRFLFDGHRLGQVPRFIYIASFAHSHIISEQL